MSGTVEGLLFTEDEPVTGRAGDVLVAPASARAYWELEALVGAKAAELIGIRYNPDGDKYIAVLLREEISGMHRNATMRIGREFFTTALRDYSDWPEKWWREAIQNSVDAGATKIDCKFEETPDGYRVSCSDDGAGMDEDTIINKFLVLGGTTKQTGAGTTGGFGKAKELLVLPWLAWRLHSRDTIVTGVGMDYEVERAESRKGTELSVVMAADQTTTPAAAMAFIEKCYLPHVRFTVYDTRWDEPRTVKAQLQVGEPLRSWHSADLFYSKKTTFRQKLLVRARGMYMFDDWIADGVEGTLIIEITRPSIEVLTANRDGFRDNETRRAVQLFVNELAANTKSAVRKKAGLVRQKFEGTGKFSLRDREWLKSEVLAAIAESESNRDVAPQRKIDICLTDEQRRSVIDAMQTRMRAYEESETYGHVSHREAEMRSMFAASPDVLDEMLKGVELRGPTQLEAVVQQLAWQPDFFIINEIEGFRVPKKFYPEGMTPQIRKLAQFWAEMCRFVLMQLGSTEEFGVGFVFEEGVGAQYVHEAGDHWLLLNPLKGRGRSYLHVLSLSQSDDVKWLYAAAVHECTHMADGITYHDESFATALTRNMARTLGQDTRVRKIRQMVVSRKALRANAHTDTITAAEVSQLPVGSIVWMLTEGGGGEALVVIGGGEATPLAMLPQQADYAPQGAPIDEFGHRDEFLVIAVGRDKVPVHAAAQRKAIAWWNARTSRVEEAR